MRFHYRDVVANSPADVFALISDIERKHEWVAEVQRSWQTSPGAVGVGTTYVDVVRFMGRTSEIPTQITAYEPGQRLTYRHTDGPIKGELDYQLAPVGAGTELRVTIDAEVPAYLRLLGPLLPRIMTRQMDGNFAALERTLADGDTKPGPAPAE